MRVYNFERAVVTISNYEGEGKSATVTEIKKEGSVRSSTLENFDHDALMDDLNKDYGDLLSTCFFD